MKTILAAIDFSDVSDSVIDMAKQLATAFESRLLILHAAAPDPAFVGYEVGPQNERDWRASKLHEEHSKLSEIAQDLRRSGIDVLPKLEQGSTVEVLQKEIDRNKVEMLVIGSHGHGAMYDVLVGSVTKDALKTLKVPIVVVPAET